MKIGIIRHAKVLFRDSFFSTGKLFEQARLGYDAAAIAETNFKITPEEFPVCYASSQQRAMDTAKAIYSGSFQITGELTEVPTTALFFSKVHLPSTLRSVIGRTAWLFNSSQMPETRNQSNVRAQKFLTHLIQETQQNTLLVTHGFFMQSLRHELRKLHFKGSCPWCPKNAVLYVFERHNK